MAPRVMLGYFIFKALLFYPPCAIVMRLHGRDGSHVVIVIPETADLLGLREVASLVVRICPVPATMRMLFCPHGTKFKEEQEN